MKFYLTERGGKSWELPTALEWKLCYGSGTPCDSFEIKCAWGNEIDGSLSQAAEFTARRDGETVFRGVVDDYECSWGSGGGILEVAGRGMAALLLDNEAESADYQVATLEDILRDHVTPYGIQAARKGSVEAVSGFSVESGQSEWQVLRSFVRYYGGVEPRFDRRGQLLLDGWNGGKKWILDDTAAALDWRWRERRYGRLSQVMVRNRVSKTVQQAADQEFLEKGGRCRRVITMPGESSGSAMRYSGAYQIAEAKKGCRQLEVTLAGAFGAWPGDTVELRRSHPALGGIWRVTQMESGSGGGGDYTALTLEEEI